MNVPDHISCSSMANHARCPAAYVYARQFPERKRTHWKAAIGKLIDTAINWYLGSSEKRGSLEDCLIEIEGHIGSYLPKPEETIAPTDGATVEEWWFVHAAPAVLHWEREIGRALLTQVVEVQADLSASFSQVDQSTGAIETVKLVGYPDAIAKDETGFYIIDNKSTGKSGGWSGDDVAEQLQHVAYAQLLESARGIAAVRHEYHIIRYASGTRPLARPQFQKIVCHPSVEQRAGFRRLMFARWGEMTTNLRRGWGPPIYGWGCRECAFRDDCRSDWGTTPPGGREAAPATRTGEGEP